MSFKVSFPASTHQAVCLEGGKILARDLSVINSPVLFGCRTGICGTCLVEIESGADALPPPEEAEREALSVYAPDNPRARLACQIDLSADISLRKIESA